MFFCDRTYSIVRRLTGYIRVLAKVLLLFSHNLGREATVMVD